MPFYLTHRDVSPELSNVRSALIVPCRFCPAASLAVREKKPYIQPFRSFLRTAAYDASVQEVKSHLEQAGTKAEVFDSRLPHHFVVCMWPSRRRQELGKRASGHDAVIVLGCDAAVKTAQDAVRSSSCRVMPGMDVEGIMNVIPSVRFPCTISLEVTGVTRVLAGPAETVESGSPATAAQPPR